MKYRGYVEELEKVPATELIELVALIRASEADTDLSWAQRRKLSELITEKISDGIIERRRARAQVGEK